MAKTVAQELKKQYDVKAVGPEDLATTTVDVLIAVMPSSLTDQEMQSLVDYVTKGKPTLIVDDPFPVFAPGLAPHNPKPRPGGMMGMMGGGPQQEKADRGKATKLSNALGIGWNSGIAADEISVPSMGIGFLADGGGGDGHGFAPVGRGAARQPTAPR